MSEEAEALCGGDPELGADVTGFSPYGLMLVPRAAALTMLGRLEDAAHEAGRAIEIGRRRKDAEVLRAAHDGSASLCALAGDAQGALRHAREGGSPFAAAMANHANRRWREAAEGLEGVVMFIRELRSNLEGEARLLGYLAEAYLGCGDTGRARQTADAAVAIARQRQQPHLEIRALLVRARVVLATDGAPAAAEVETALRDATALVDATAARIFAPFIQVERAELARVLGDAVGRKRELAEAHRLFTETGAKGHAERVAGELERRSGSAS